MQIAILLYPEFTALDAIGPYEMFAHVPGHKVTFVAKEKGLIPADTGVLKIAATHSISEVDACDILIIPGGGGEFAARKDEHILNWIRKIHETTKYTTTVCTGSLLLAKTGLLNGVDATSHWAAEKWLEELGDTYKAERWVERGKIITAAGVSAGIDMALYLIGKLHGESVAKTVQLATEYDPDPPFDSGSVAKADPRSVETISKLFDASRAAA